MTFDDALIVTPEPGRDLGGLSVEETAAVLTVSLDTVMRDWKLAKAWLHRKLREQEARRGHDGKGATPCVQCRTIAG